MSSDEEEEEHMINSNDENEEEVEKEDDDEDADKDEEAEEIVDAKLEKWFLTFEEIEEDEGERACSNLSPAAKYCADNTVPPKLRKKVTQMVIH
jgi:hypothetical protein